jgi:CHASE2 domain-containing sensor protein
MKESRLHEGISFRRHFLLGMVLVGIATVLTAFLHESWLIKPIEVANLNGMFRLLRNKGHTNVTVVEVTEGDYRHIFGGGSPMNKGALQRLIQEIDKAGPRAVVVDIETREWSLDEVVRLGLNAPFVWVRTGRNSNREGDLSEQTYKMEAVLGGEGGGIRWGHALLGEENGMARYYFPSIMSASGGRVPFVIDSLCQAIQSGNPGCTGDKSTRPEAKSLIPYVADHEGLRRISASGILELANAPGWERNAAIAGRIVLIGGAYRDARDDYVTPLGAMPGVEVLANIIEAELSDRTVQAATPESFIVLDIVFGALLVISTYFLERRWKGWALLITFVGVPLLALSASLALFALPSNGRYFLSFIPVVAGVLVHASVEHIHEYRRLMKVVRSYEAG